MFWIFAISNFFVFCQALGLLGIGIYLIIFTENANVFDIGFIIVAVVLGILSYLAFRWRKDLGLLGVYIGILLFVFLI